MNVLWWMLGRWNLVRASRARVAAGRYAARAQAYFERVRGASR